MTRTIWQNTRVRGARSPFLCSLCRLFGGFLFA